jgi:hypothetical protein
MLSGCATSWQNKSTNTYTGGAIALKAVDTGAKPPCLSGTFPVDKCDRVRAIGKKTITSYTAAGNILALGISTTDAVKRDELMEQWPVLWADFNNLTNEIIDLIQNLEAMRTGTPAPTKEKIAITPIMIEIIIAGLKALLTAIPDLWALIQSGQVDEKDIVVLVDRIHKAQDSVKVLFVW